MQSDSVISDNANSDNVLSDNVNSDSVPTLRRSKRTTKPVDRLDL